MKVLSFTYDKIKNIVSKKMVGVISPADVKFIGSAEDIKTQINKSCEVKASMFFTSVEEDWFKYQEVIQILENELTVLKTVVSDNITTTDSNTTTAQLTDAEKTKRIEAIEGYDAVVDGKTIHYDGEIEKPLLARNNLELQFQWLKAYRGIQTTVKKPVVKAVIPTELKKKLIAYERDQKVRNNEDSVADLAKMNALLMAMTSGIFSVLTQTQKNAMDPTKLGLIEYAISKWINASTRADRQLATEGTALIDKLFDREVEIADIVDKFI